MVTIYSLQSIKDLDIASGECRKESAKTYAQRHDDDVCPGRRSGIVSASKVEPPLHFNLIPSDLISPTFLPFSYFAGLLASSFGGIFLMRCQSLS